MIASFLSPSYIYFLSYNTVLINTFHSPIFLFKLRCRVFGDCTGPRGLIGRDDV
jgi:hypothetical protein